MTGVISKAVVGYIIMLSLLFVIWVYGDYLVNKAKGDMACENLSLGKAVEMEKLSLYSGDRVICEDGTMIELTYYCKEKNKWGNCSEYAYGGKIV
jgi:hypothetical protein